MSEYERKTKHSETIPEHLKQWWIVGGDNSIAALEARHQAAQPMTTQEPCETCGSRYHTKRDMPPPEKCPECAKQTGGGLCVHHQEEARWNERAQLAEALEVLKTLRHRLWTRRTRFGASDHEAMNAASSLLERLEKG